MVLKTSGILMFIGHPGVQYLQAVQPICGMLIQYFFQKFGTAVIGESEMTNFAFVLHLQSPAKTVVFFIDFVI